VFRILCQRNFSKGQKVPIFYYHSTGHYNCRLIRLFLANYFSELYGLAYILLLYAFAYTMVLYALTYKWLKGECAVKQRARTSKQLGAIIRRERRKQQLTQAQLGQEIGLRQATVSKLEAGEPATQLRTLLDALTVLKLEIILEKRGESSTKDIEGLF
jgi:HTH-type transcriptional regulator/antitoxin HipB